jgi:hypothetical protein
MGKQHKHWTYLVFLLRSAPHCSRDPAIERFSPGSVLKKISQKKG